MLSLNVVKHLISITCMPILLIQVLCHIINQGWLILDREYSVKGFKRMYIMPEVGPIPQSRMNFVL